MYGLLNGIALDDIGSVAWLRRGECTEAAFADASRLLFGSR
jgi:hypothetical protein